MRSHFKLNRPWMGQSLMAATLVGLAGLLAVLSFEAVGSGSAPSVATVNVSGEFLDVESHVAFDDAVLRIAGPNNYALTMHLPAKASIFTAHLVTDASPRITANDTESPVGAEFNPKGSFDSATLADGTYHYELHMYVDNEIVGTVRGTFKVQNGSAFQPARSEPGPRADETLTYRNEPGLVERAIAGVANFLVSPASAQSGDFDDFVSIRNTTGTGQSRLNLNATDSITVNADAWRLMNDADANRFDIVEGVDTERLSITQGGNVGIGTTAPQELLHVDDGSSLPAIRLGGFRWTHSSVSSFFRGFSEQGIVQILGAAPAASLRIIADGNVGMGTASPDASLHVLRSNGTAQVLVEDTGGVDGQTMFSLLNGGGHPKFRLQDAAQSDVRWEFRTAGTQGASERFQINKLGSGAINAEFQANGNLTIAGTLSQGSSRSIKDNITPVDDSTLLAKLESLTLSEWSYASDLNERHVGPMAEDFHATFGLGPDDKHISPTDLAGVALAAAKALKADNDAKDQRIAELEARMARLEAMLD